MQTSGAQLWLVRFLVLLFESIHESALADYRQFASDNPEKLAKAIEQGIPKALRGMMWQLMYVLSCFEIHN